VDHRIRDRGPEASADVPEGTAENLAVPVLLVLGYCVLVPMALL
jgi:hypothetical protein